MWWRQEEGTEAQNNGGETTWEIRQQLTQGVMYLLVTLNTDLKTTDLCFFPPNSSELQFLIYVSFSN